MLDAVEKLESQVFFIEVGIAVIIAAVIGVIYFVCTGYTHHKVLELGEMKSLFTYSDVSVMDESFIGSLKMSGTRNGSVIFEVSHTNTEAKAEVSSDDVENIISAINTCQVIGSLMDPLSTGYEEQAITLFRKSRFSNGILVQFMTFNTSQDESQSRWAVVVGLADGKDTMMFVLSPSDLKNFKNLLNRRDYLFYKNELDKIIKLSIL